MSGVLLANIKSPFPAAQLASAANLERQGEPGAALDRGSYVDLAPARNRLVRTLEFVERRRTASPSPASCGGSVRGSRWPVLLLGMSPAENWFSEVISQYDISKRRCSRELLPLALLGFVLRGGKQMPLPAASMQVQPLHLANNNSAGALSEQQLSRKGFGNHECVRCDGRVPARLGRRHDFRPARGRN